MAVCSPLPAGLQTRVKRLRVSQTSHAGVCSWELSSFCLSVPISHHAAQCGRFQALPAHLDLRLSVRGGNRQLATVCVCTHACTGIDLLRAGTWNMRCTASSASQIRQVVAVSQCPAGPDLSQEAGTASRLKAPISPPLLISLRVPMYN
jgi:hypothetical protein